MDKERKRPLLPIQRSRRAANDFMRSAMRKYAPKDEENGFDLAMRFRNMSDEDFDKGVADGSITRDQIRKAGQNEYENYILDVWSETDDAENMPEPSYEEFMENPGKYGAEDQPDAEEPRRLYRYKPSRYTSEGAGGR